MVGTRGLPRACWCITGFSDDPMQINCGLQHAGRKKEWGSGFGLACDDLTLTSKHGCKYLAQDTFWFPTVLDRRGARGHWETPHCTLGRDAIWQPLRHEEGIEPCTPSLLLFLDILHSYPYYRPVGEVNHLIEKRRTLSRHVQWGQRVCMLRLRLKVTTSLHQY